MSASEVTEHANRVLESASFVLITFLSLSQARTASLNAALHSIKDESVSSNDALFGASNSGAGGL